MNGVHDMGGMHGLGPIAPDPNEPLFHEPWEARALALTLACGAWGRWTIDKSRHARERIPGPDYLRMSYYEKWITALEALLIDADLITAEELASPPPQGEGDPEGVEGAKRPEPRQDAPFPPSGGTSPKGGREARRPFTPPLTVDRVAESLARGSPCDRPATKPPAYAVGDRVRARNINPVGHTRLPRYARGHVGVITADHGSHVFPDANAHDAGEQPQPLYQVRFEAAELWGAEAGGRAAVYLDLWEAYLDRA